MDSISRNAARVSLNTSNREQRRDIESYFGVTLYRIEFLVKAVTILWVLVRQKGGA